MERGGLLDLELISGHITVTGTSGNQVRVRAEAEDGEIVLRASATLAKLTVEYDRRPRGEVRFEVSVPAGVRVTMEAVSGNLSARGIGADVDLTTVSGSVDVHDIEGMAKVEAVSGQIRASGIRGGLNIDATSGQVTVSDVDGEVTVDNTSGMITLTNIRSKLVRAESVSGGVRFQGAIEPSGRYDFASHSGSIRLELPASTSAQLTLSTYNGSLSSDFPITLDPRSRSSERRLEFRLGNGGARLSAETFSGSITITRGTGRERQE
jgi:DUF4097 and DUF4098 domain-containing protein YvlB